LGPTDCLYLMRLFGYFFLFWLTGLKWLVLQCINGVSSNAVEGRTQIWQLKDLILTLFGLIFRLIYIILTLFGLIFRRIYIRIRSLSCQIFVIKNCWVRLLSNYNIKYICTIYTRLDTCLMSISRFALRDKVTRRLLKLYFNIAGVVQWSRALDIRLSDWQQSNSAIFNIL
jgi:hypothetical protein